MISLAKIEQWVRDRKVILLLLIIIGLGSFLRFYNLGTESLWLDEVVSLNESAKIMHGIIGHMDDMPLYILILNLWIHLFGNSEVALRFLSAIFGVISILLIYQVGSTLFNRRVGIISSLLSAISCFYIYYSQEARCYSLLLLLSLLSYYFFIGIIKHDKKWHYLCYFLTNILLGYTHFYSLFIIISQVLFFILFWNKYRLQRAKFSGTIGATIIAFLPYLYLLFKEGTKLIQHGFWIPEPGLRSIYNTFAEFSGSGLATSIILLVFFVLVLVGLFSIHLVAGKWRWRRPVESLKNLTWNVRLESIEEELLLIIWLSISIVIPFIESKFMTPIYFTRYMIGASPALYLLVAKGIGNLNRKWFLYPILIFIILLSSLGLYQYYKNDVKEQWREVASFVVCNSTGNDVIFFCANYCQNPFDYYYPGGLPEYGIGKDVTSTQELATSVDNAVQGKDRLWLILSYGGKSAPVKSYLVERYGSGSIIIQRAYIGVTVILLDLSPP